MNEENMDQLEIQEAASTLVLLKSRCNERNQWQRVRSSFLLHQPQIMNPYYSQWPFYKPYPCDVTSGFPIHLQPFHFPYMVGPRPWYPTLQPWYEPLRKPDVTTPLPAPSPSRITDKNRVLVTVETNDDVTDQDENEDSLGEQDEYIPPSTEKRKRRNLTKKQQEILEKAYCSTKYPDIKERLKLSEATQLTEDRIQIWFQNRRAKDRRMADTGKSPNGAFQERCSADVLNEQGGVDTAQFGSPIIKEDGEPSAKRLRREEE